MRMRSYHRMTVEEKEKFALDRLRPPSMRCPDCEVAVTPQDLLGHRAGYCRGRGDPHPRDRWIQPREALTLGLNHMTLWRWAKRGLVRTRKEGWSHAYLERDIVREIALRRRR